MKVNVILDTHRQETSIRERKIESDEYLLLRDPNFLPTRKQLKKIFGNWGQEDWPKWFELCFNEKEPIYEFWTEEYIGAFADYLRGRVEEYCIILEVGAGDGRLSHFLKQKLGKRANKIKVIATDSGEYGIKPQFPVEKLTHTKALEKYKPEIVICSWMPYKVDFTADFRKCPSVMEYILIGDADDGCGDPWKTWGLPPIESLYDPSKECEIPPYERDGFERKNLYDLSRLQICRTDLPGSLNFFQLSHSSTVSFRRIKKRS